MEKPMIISVLQVLALMSYLQWQQFTLLEITEWYTTFIPLSQLTCCTIVKTTLLFMYILHRSRIIVSLIPYILFVALRSDSESRPTITPLRNHITTLDRTPLNKLSARRRGPYLTTHDIHTRQTTRSFPGFEPQYQLANDRRPTPKTKPSNL